MRRRRILAIEVILLAISILTSSTASHAEKNKRDKKAEKLPHVDLSAYSVLVIEDFSMTDPKAANRKKTEHVEAAPTRIPDEIRRSLGDEVFTRVERGSADATDGALILQAEITQYKPGSKSSRMMMAGTGSAHLDLLVRLIDAHSGDRLMTFPMDRTWAWGGAMGGSKDIVDMEINVANELAAYLEQCKLGEAADGD